MNSSTTTAVNRELQVGASGRCFSERLWKEAILHFLFGLWSGDVAVTMRPKISFGGVTLRLVPDTKTLHPGTWVYCAYGVGSDMWSIGEEAFHAKWEARLSVGNRKEHVEVALVRFVKDHRIRVLAINSGSAGSGGVLLWKTSRRGEYRCMSIGLPATWEDCAKALGL